VEKPTGIEPSFPKQFQTGPPTIYLQAVAKFSTPAAATHRKYVFITVKNDTNDDLQIFTLLNKHLLMQFNMKSCDCNIQEICSMNWKPSKICNGI
jgi:hypothetical protein